MNDYREPLSELVDRVDLPTLVESYAGQGRHSAGKWTFRCPHPAHDDRSPSFSVFQSQSGKWRAHCFACDFDGDALDVVRWLDGGDVAAAADRLRSITGTPRDLPRPRAPLGRRAPAPVRPSGPSGDWFANGSEWFPLNDAGAARRLMDAYLSERGWPAWVADRFGLSVVLDQYRKPRIRHPFHAWSDSDGGPDGTWVVCAWQDRATQPAQRPKWMTPAGAVLAPYNLPSFPSADQLAGIIITEGPADCITAVVALGTHTQRLAVIGVAGASGWRPQWGALLAGHPVVIAADPDEAGEKLVAAVRTGYRGPRLAVVRLAHGDLTDTAKAVGMDAVRELLVAPFGIPPTQPPTGTDPTTEHSDTEPAENVTPEPATSGGVGRARLASAHRPCAVCGRAMMAGQDRQGAAHFSCASSAAVCTCNPERVAWLMDAVVPVLGADVLPAPCPIHETGAHPMRDVA